MNLAVMQPYLFPYVGYFQLIYASDLFLIYDDVSFIKQGYINRNTILTNSGPARFTVPVPGASSNKLITSLEFSRDIGKVLKTIEQSYSKKTYFDDVFPIIKGILEYEDRDIANICQKSYLDILKYIGVERKFKKTSDIQYDRSQSAKEKLFEFCHMYNADTYINTPGGRDLYKAIDFKEHNIELKFIQSEAKTYGQGEKEFIPNLSIIDILMNCSIVEIRDLLACFSLD